MVLIAKRQQTKALIKDLFERVAVIHECYLPPESYTAESSARLNEQIVHSELMEIYSFMEELNFVMLIDDVKERRAALIQLITNPTYSKKIDETPENQALRAQAIEKEFLSMMAMPQDRQVFRFPKEMTHLARTVLIVRTLEGFQLNLETMSKTANHQVGGEVHSVTGRIIADKNKALNVPKGGFKRAKRSRRIDVPLHQSDVSINLTLKTAPANFEVDLRDIQNEARIAQEFDSPHIAKMYISAPFVGNKGDKKVTIISPRGVPLDALLKAKPFANQSIWTTNELIAGLLLGAKVFNTRFIHQDIKPDNILVFQNQEGKYVPVLTDFGLSVPLGDRSRPTASAGYQSPEMSAYSFHFRKKNKFYQKKSYINALGYALFLEEAEHFPKESMRFQRSDSRNDSWAMGITLFELLYGRRPTKADLPEIRTDKLLNALLQVNPENRITLEAAYELHLEQMDKLKKYAEEMEKTLLVDDFMVTEGFSQLYLSSLKKKVINKYKPALPGVVMHTSIVRTHAQVFKPAQENIKERLLEDFFVAKTTELEVSYQRKLDKKSHSCMPSFNARKNKELLQIEKIKMLFAQEGIPGEAVEKAQNAIELLADIRAKNSGKGRDKLPHLAVLCEEYMDALRDILHPSQAAFRPKQRKS